MPPKSESSPLESRCPQKIPLSHPSLSLSLSLSLSPFGNLWSSILAKYRTKKTIANPRGYEKGSGFADKKCRLSDTDVHTYMHLKFWFSIESTELGEVQSFFLVWILCDFAGNGRVEWEWSLFLVRLTFRCVLNAQIWFWFCCMFESCVYEESFANFLVAVFVYEFLSISVLVWHLPDDF